MGRRERGGSEGGGEEKEDEGGGRDRQRERERGEEEEEETTKQKQKQNAYGVPTAHATKCHHKMVLRSDGQKYEPCCCSLHCGVRVARSVRTGNGRDVRSRHDGTRGTTSTWQSARSLDSAYKPPHLQTN